MDWIKKNTHQFILALLALVLLAVSVIIFLNTQSFEERFAEANRTASHNRDVQKVDTTILDEAQKTLAQPKLWGQGAENGSLFVSWKLVLNPTTKQLERVDVAGSMLHPPIPNLWLQKHGLDLLSSTVRDDDPDQDGFTNKDEYLGTDRSAPTDPQEAEDPKDSTDPKDKSSHPAYYTKLFLKQYIKVPFRLLFNGIDGDPAKDKPEAMSYQINTVDLGGSSEFLKLGDVVRNTRFKLLKFEYKTKMNEKIQELEDVSELTVQHLDTGDSIALVWRKVTDSPDSYALFDYQWPSAANPQPIRVKKLGAFVLKPNIQEQYKLIDIKEAEAQIQLPNGEKYIVPPVPTK